MTDETRRIPLIDLPPQTTAFQQRRLLAVEESNKLIAQEIRDAKHTASIRKTIGEIEALPADRPQAKRLASLKDEIATTLVNALDRMSEERGLLGTEFSRTSQIQTLSAALTEKNPLMSPVIAKYEAEKFLAAAPEWDLK